jgi:hypothetical protein
MNHDQGGENEIGRSIGVLLIGSDAMAMVSKNFIVRWLLEQRRKRNG